MKKFYWTKQPPPPKKQEHKPPELEQYSEDNSCISARVSDCSLSDETPQAHEHERAIEKVKNWLDGQELPNSELIGRRKLLQDEFGERKELLHAWSNSLTTVEIKEQKKREKLTEQLIDQLTKEVTSYSKHKLFQIKHSMEQHEYFIKEAARDPAEIAEGLRLRKKFYNALGIY